ncbi:MAG TPA: flagellin [Bryobacteraceae bacterium]|nr:flagellin [Bryobacteraceae bacterium]
MGSFSINTNIASLQAQNYLRINQGFQNQTINEVTSGLRIVNSGDDAAGLAIANGYRSQEAVLTQGISNANDGLSQLQIADGGLNNISQLLDRASTLATQSASGTFTGNRSILNNEFQSVLGEINREAQSIGLNQGGTFAKALSVFVGGGAGSTTSAQTANGSVSLDLSQSTVDTQSLGLNGFVAGYQVASGAQDSGLYDLGAASATSVAAIIQNTGATSTSFQISGPGFSGANAQTLNVNLSNVGDTTTLASAINAALQSDASTGTAAAQALKNANIVAQVHTGSDGHQQLQFVSSNSAFQVTALDTTANGLLGNLGTNTGGAFTGSTSTPEAATLAAASFAAAGTQQYSAAFTTLTTDAATPDAQTLTFTALNANGVPQTAKVTLAASTTVSLTGAGAVAAINTALQATDNPALQDIVASTDPTGGTITFSSASSSKFTLSIGLEAGVDAGTGLANPNTVQTSSVVGTGTSVSVNTQSAAQAAVTALANAVTVLGSAQGVVGRGENQFHYAINLASSQNTNLATAESGIRDANLAQEAANLTKAQILLQAGVAALAQANSAPQNILSLLKA